MSKAAVLKSLLQRRAATPVPGVYDAFSALLVEQAGFESCFVSGAGLAASMLGLPDIGILSMRDQINGVQAIANAVDIPVMADGDTGFGNAVNTFHAVRLLESAGAAGINIEDQTFPKRCGHFDDKGIISQEEMVQKIRAAVSAKRDPDFVINARTDALAAEGIEGAIRRANAYLAAGADIAFIEALQSREQIERAAVEVKGLLSVNMLGTTGGKTPAIPLEDLRQMGIARVSYPGVTIASAAGAMRRALVALKRDGILDAVQSEMMSFQDTKAVIGFQREMDRGARFAN